MSDNPLLVKIHDLLLKAVGQTHEPIIDTGTETKDSDIIMKAVNEEERLVLGVVLEPNTPDLHNDIYDADEVRKGCESFNTHCEQLNIQHLANTTEMTVTKSFIQEVDAMIGEQVVKAGSWLMEAHIPNDVLWDEVKSNGFTGWSIGCDAKVEDI